MTLPLEFKTENSYCWEVGRSISKVNSLPNVPSLSATYPKIWPDPLSGWSIYAPTVPGWLLPAQRPRSSSAAKESSQAPVPVPAESVVKYTLTSPG